MGRYYSPSGNFEVWDEKPEGYYTKEEWDALHPAPPPPEPTKEEKLAQLDSQYDSDKALLSQYFVDAMLAGDTELQAELRQELAEMDADYITARQEIEEE